ncbi:MAG: RHS repeat protein, partial [Deltaproteobacteria bacterium]|nr:RHS repeat protein [Deltaproteobacteria bacterium]
MPIYHLEYGAHGKINMVHDEHGRQVNYTWEDSRLLTVTDVLGKTTRYSYSGEGRLVSKADESGRKFFITYHDDGSVKSVLSRQGGGHTFSYSHDPYKNTYYAKSTSTMGKIREYWFDEKGETKKVAVNGHPIREELWFEGKRTVIDELGGRRVKTYDDRANLLQEEFSDGTAISYSYDNTNNLISKVNELGIETRYSHNLKGQATAMREAYKTADEVLTEYDYDSRGNRIISTLYQGKTPVVTVYEYDERDNLLRVTDALYGSQEFTYDYMGNVIQATDQVDLSRSMEYDGLGNLLTIITADGRRITSGYDA